LSRLPAALADQFSEFAGLTKKRHYGAPLSYGLRRAPPVP
jgi:hypothetical protein